jgi:hypothetical protein
MVEGNPPCRSQLVGEKLDAVCLMHLVVCFPNKFGPTESQHSAGCGAIHKSCGSKLACEERDAVCLISSRLMTLLQASYEEARPAIPPTTP